MTEHQEDRQTENTSPPLDSSVEEFIAAHQLLASSNNQREFLRFLEDYSGDDKWFALAIHLFEGEQLKLDKDLAIEIWKTLSDSGNSVASGVLGELMIRGQDIPEDVSYGIELLDRAAEGGGLQSLQSLTNIFLNGWKDISPNPEKAIVYMEKAAELGDIEAMLTLSSMLENQPYEDHGKAFKFDEMAAYSGDARGYYNLGRRFERGLGVDQNFAKAIKHYSIAAKAGEMMAQHNLAALYARGEGAEQDFQLARVWYMVASTQGSYFSMNNLGDMSLNGEGMEQDKSNALAWYSLAKNHGEKGLDDKISELTSELSEQEIKKGIERIDAHLKKVKEMLGEAADRAKNRDSS